MDDERFAEAEVTPDTLIATVKAYEAIATHNNSAVARMPKPDRLSRLEILEEHILLQVELLDGFMLNADPPATSQKTAA